MSIAPAEAGGPGVLSSARVLRIAFPIVLANLTVPLLGLVDTAVVGQMGAAAPIGAVGLGATILTMLYWLFGFLRMGMTGLTAQAAGAGEHAEVAALLSRGLVLGLGGGLVFVALQVPLFAGAFLLAPAPSEVEDLARSYLSIRIWSAPAAIAAYAVTGWLIAVERTRALLVLQLVTNGTNIVLSVAFVLGAGWGVEGVAWAPFIAEWG
ncbi:MAG: MATE family efflux transporter, partial [Rhodobacteraceae bacterium]|nr:MATE family efflux transporter [Paracoccaceae bacterium]